MPGKHMKYSQARALLFFFVREINHLSLCNLANFLKRDPSSLSQLAARFENKIGCDALVAQNVNEIRRWLQEYD